MLTCRAKHFEFVPLTPLEESFEEENTLLQCSNVDHSVMTSSTPSLSIVSDNHSTSNDHSALSSHDANKPASVVTTLPSYYKRPPAVVSSLVDPVLHNKFTRYLNGSFESTLGYTTTDITSDVDSIDHVKQIMAIENNDKLTRGRVDNGVQVVDKTHKGTQDMTCKETQRSTELDNLWKEFITGPLYTDWVRSPDRMCYCEQLKQIEYKSRHCVKLPVKQRATIHCHGSGNTSDTTLYSDTGVQTSPSLLTVTRSTGTTDALIDCPCVSSHVIKASPPSSDNSFDDQGSCGITESCDITGSCEQPASLTDLSLQEACRLFKKDFISNSQRRQRMIHHTRRQREEESVINQHKVALANMAREYKRQYQNGEYNIVTQMLQYL